MEIVNVLNLSRRTDRALAIIEESKQHNFAVKFWEAIDEPLRKDVKKAICIGHKRIVRYASDNNLEEIIIAEDDLEFLAPGAFEYFLKNKPADFDLYCGTIFDGETSEDDNRILNGMSATMSLYIISKRFYNFILNEMPDDCHIDRYLGDHAFRFKYYVPPYLVCTQRQGYSDNLKQKTGDYNVYLERRKLFTEIAIQ